MTRLLLIALLVLLAGCRSSRTVAVQNVPPTAVNATSDTLLAAPRLARMPRAGLRTSLPETVTRFAEPLPEETETFEVAEIEIDREHVTIRTPTGEHRFRNTQNAGERQRIRDVQTDSARADSLVADVAGELVADEVRVELPREPGIIEQLTGLVRWIFALALLAGAVIIAKRFI